MGQRQGLLLRLECVLRKVAQLAVGGQGEPGSGDLRHQAELCAASRFLGAEIGLERLLAEAADPSEEVELPGRQAKTGAVLPADGRVAAAGEVARRARGRLTDPGVDRREAVGTLDAILSAGLLDVERRDPQIAVVGQCEFDQLA